MSHPAQNTSGQPRLPLEQGRELADRIRDRSIKACAFAEVAAARVRAKLPGVPTFHEAMQIADEEPRLNWRAYAYCTIALAEAAARVDPSESLARAADSVAQSQDPEGFEHVYLAITRARLGISPMHQFLLAKKVADRTTDRVLRDEHFAFIAWSEARAGFFETAAMTADRIADPLRQVHTFCELAVAESVSRKEPHSLELARRRLEYVLRPADVVDGNALLASAAALSGNDATSFLSRAEAVLRALSDSPDWSFAQSRIAAAEAQAGRLDDAKFRAVNIPDERFRAAAWKAIATEEGWCGRLEDAEGSAEMIGSISAERDSALRAIATAAATSLTCNPLSSAGWRLFQRRWGPDCTT